MSTLDGWVEYSQPAEVEARSTNSHGILILLKTIEDKNRAIIEKS